jgi:VWFA-related protein
MTNSRPRSSRSLPRRTALLALLALTIVAGAIALRSTRAQEAVPPDPAPGPPPAESAPPPPKPPDARSRKGFSVQLTNPQTNDFRYGKSEIDAEVKASDPGMVEKVEFYVDDKLIFIDTEAPYRCVFDFGTEPRSWVIRVVAYHREGVTVSDTAILRKVVLNYAVQVNRIVMYATATSDEGARHFVVDLTKNDVVLEEDGVRQPILDFYREERPATLAVLSDSSGSMQASMNTVHTASSRFIDSLGPDDRALVIDFDDKVYLLQDVTGDKDALRNAVTSTNAFGGTALYDALYAAYRKLRAVEGRKAIVILSDGDDTASKFSFKRVLDEAKINDMIIYSIGLGTSFLDIDLRHVLRTLAEETGGRAFFPGKVDELEGVYKEIAAELKSQYYVSYEPQNTVWDGRWRKLKLSSTRKSVDIRTRSGYYAVRRAG